MLLCRLQEIGKYTADFCSFGGSVPSSDENSRKAKGPPHCSLCGHPGSKSTHLKFPCEYCNSDPAEGCLEKPVSFKCNCSSCDMVHILLDNYGHFLSIVGRFTRGQTPGIWYIRACIF